MQLATHTPLGYLTFRLNRSSPMRQVRLDVDGMSCGHCVHSVREALAALPGVTITDVRIGAVTLQLDESRSLLGDIIDAVQDAGYEAREATP
jgi:copper chaperone CopZ